jgi:hypothetical protein
MELNSVDINWVAVIVATVAAMVIGGVWYGVLSEQWLAAVGKTKEEMSGSPARGYGVALVCAFVTAVTLSAVADWAGADDVVKGVCLGLIVWAGFILTSKAMAFVFEERPLRLFLIQAGHDVISFAVVGAIIAAMQ